jgi:hypothetical protein
MSDYLKPKSFLPPLSTLAQINFTQIIREFPEKKSHYYRPRIAFLGQFNYLSLTDQRYLCQALGFEAFENLVALVSETENGSSDKTGSLLAMWQNIKKNSTQLVVIGEAATEKIQAALYRQYAKDLLPLIEQYKIPVLMESEIIQLHPNYPKINKSTVWKGLIFSETTLKFR